MIYLDHNATTPLDARVLEAMLPALQGQLANAASRQHAPGRAAAEAVEAARCQVARVIGADPREIVFTSGAAGSNNLALLGAAASAASSVRPGDHIITVASEHRAVLEPCEHLERRGFRVSWLGVDGEGRLDLEELSQAIADRTLLVSIMHANNETGVLHPVQQIARLCAERGVLFHTDATQSFGKEPLDVAWGVSLLSASAHKFYGPQGVGLLYVRRRAPRVRLTPRVFGGGHERGLRSGTSNVPGIVGMGRAAELCEPSQQVRIRALRDRLEQRLRARLDGVLVNGGTEQRLANTSNLSFAGIDADALMQSLPGIAVSSSAACSSASPRPSHVLGAMGCDDARMRGSIRFSLGRGTSEAEIELAVEQVVDSVARLRAHGPPA